MGETRSVSLRYTPQALSELAQVLEDIAAHSPKGAKRVQSRIKTIAGLLVDYPHSGQSTSVQEMRRVVVSPFPYLLFYKLVGNDVVIVGIRHGARSPEAYPGDEGIDPR
jgi:toxin ParE1/3/4